MATSIKVAVMLSMTLTSVGADDANCNSPRVGTCTFFGCNSDHGATQCVHDPAGGTSWGQPNMICVCAPDSEAPCVTATDQYHCVAKPKPQACTVGHKAQVRNGGEDVWLTGVVTKADPCEVQPDGWSESFTFKQVRKAPDAYNVGEAVVVKIGGNWVSGNVKGVNPTMILPEGWGEAFAPDHFEDVRPKDWDAIQKAAGSNLEQAKKELAARASHKDQAYKSAGKSEEADKAALAVAEKGLAGAKKEQQDAEDEQAKRQKASDTDADLSKKADAAAAGAKSMWEASEKAAQSAKSAMDTAAGILANKTAISEAADKRLADAKDALNNAKKQLSDAESAAKTMEEKIAEANQNGQKALAAALESGYKTAALSAVKTATELVSDRTATENKAQGQADEAKQVMDGAKQTLADKTAAYKRAAEVDAALKKVDAEEQAKADAAAKAAAQAAQELDNAKKATKEKQAATKTAGINLSKATDTLKGAENKVQSAKAASDKANAEKKNEGAVKLQDELPWNVQLTVHLPTHNNFASLLAFMTITGLLVAAVTALKPVWRSWFVTGDIRERLLPQ